MQPFVRLHVLFFEFLLGSFSRTLLPMYPSAHTPHTRTHLHTHRHHHHHLTSSASPLPLSFFYFMDANRAGSSLPQRELRAPGCPRLLPAVSAATSSASLLISSATTDPPSLSHPCPCRKPLLQALPSFVHELVPCRLSGQVLPGLCFISFSFWARLCCGLYIGGFYKCNFPPPKGYPRLSFSLTQITAIGAMLEYYSQLHSQIQTVSSFLVASLK